MAEASLEVPLEVQDDDQWLYGDEKDENKEEGEINDNAGEKSPEESSKENGQEEDASKEKEVEEGMEEAGEEEDKDDTEKTDEKEKDTEEDKPADDDEDSDDSDEDGMAITIGPLKKQTDVIQAPAAHAQKFQPKAAPTAGLKDEDFTTGGKVNGVPVADFKMDDFEDKPWRKPGADLSDYFNYGFNEDSWFKYCERQKKMRVSESGAGLGGLGIGVTPKPNYQPFPNNTSIPVSIVNDNSKYGMPPNLGGRKLAGPPPRNKERGQIDVLGNSGNKSGGNTIQVMTADRREYSNKIIGNQGLSGYEDNMDFGGNPYGNPYIPPPDPMYYGGGGGGPPGGVGGGGGGNYNDQGWSGGEWEHGGPPSGGMPTGPPPPIMPPVSGPPMYFNNEDSMGAHSMGEHREAGDNDRQRPRRGGRPRSRSPSSRHRGERERDRHREHRSRSRSPSHRHKRKKSKRERDAD